MKSSVRPRRWILCAVVGISGSLASSVRAETLLTSSLASESTSEANSATRLPSEVVPQSSPVPAWLPWTFAGLGVATALTSVGAWRVREHHVEQFNSAACLQPGRTRVQTCADEYYAGRDAETIVWVAGIGSVAFLGSALFLSQTGASIGASQSSVSVGYSGSF